MSAISWVSAIQGCPLRGVPLYLFIAERSEANNCAVCDLGWRMYIYIYIYLQVWPRAPGEPPSTVRGSAR